MNSTVSKMRLLVVGCLSATAVLGAFNVPSASAADFGSKQDNFFAQRDRDRDGIPDRFENRRCKNLKRQIEIARRRGEFRLAFRLEREYRRECSFRR